MKACLKCQGSQVIKGTVAEWSSSTSARKIFRPDHLKLLAPTFSGGVSLDAYACTDCGFVWTELDPAALRAFVESNCDTDVA